MGLPFNRNTELLFKLTEIQEDLKNGIISKFHIKLTQIFAKIPIYLRLSIFRNYESTKWSRNWNFTSFYFTVIGELCSKSFFYEPEYQKYRHYSTRRSREDNTCRSNAAPERNIQRESANCRTDNGFRRPGKRKGNYY